MKKILLIVLVVWTTSFSFAQQGNIIYTDFEPDLCVQELSAQDSHDTLKIDLDQDGTIDFKMYIESKYPTMVRYVYVTSSWDFRYCYNNIYSYGYMDENDSVIPNHTLWAEANRVWELLWSDSYMEFIMGFRKTVNGENYYAWANIYMHRNLHGNGYEPGPGEFDIVSAYCKDMAYCTIPDYPMKWGETYFSGIDENDVFSTIATLHPNPTNGLVTITGKDLKQAEVINTLGQQVATAHGEGERLIVDISALPAGVYFVNVTDEEGRKCVRKVVKE